MGTRQKHHRNCNSEMREDEGRGKHTSTPTPVCLWTVDGKNKRSPDSRAFSNWESSLTMISWGVNRLTGSVEAMTLFPDSRRVSRWRLMEVGRTSLGQDVMTRRSVAARRQRPSVNWDLNERSRLLIEYHSMHSFELSLSLLVKLVQGEGKQVQRKRAKR